MDNQNDEWRFVDAEIRNPVFMPGNDWGWGTDKLHVEDIFREEKIKYLNTVGIVGNGWRVVEHELLFYVPQVSIDLYACILELTDWIDCVKNGRISILVSRGVYPWKAVLIWHRIAKEYYYKGCVKQLGRSNFLYGFPTYVALPDGVSHIIFPGDDISKVLVSVLEGIENQVDLEHYL